MTHLFDCRDLDTSSDNVRVGSLATHLVELRLDVLDLAVVHLGQQVRHVRVHHRREQVAVQRRVPEALLETVARGVATTRVHLGFAELLFGRHVVPEGRLEGAVDVCLEGEDEEDRGDSGDPLERLEAEAQPSSCEGGRSQRRSTVL